MRLRMTIKALTVLVISAAGLLFVAVSPVLIDELTASGTVRRLDWQRLSAIGETYGTVAALFSALAFMAVTISLAIQAGEAKVNRLQAVRGYHVQLMLMAADNPRLYMSILGVSETMDSDDARRHVYATLLMNYMRMAFEARVIHEASLRGEGLAHSFREPFMREWWRTGRSYWKLGTAGTRRERKFFRIVEEEYEKAIAVTPRSRISRPVDDARMENAVRNRLTVARVVSIAAVLMGIYCILKRMVGVSAGVFGGGRL
ncbi:DUF6082 family protein [Sphaerisporangium dianthi]|uniref:DUF6082 family protein n=1 Tax=Sphaerisporangium dianthi TaxID=1436120 RepID=A0ABV9CUB1_9ACTN